MTMKKFSALLFSLFVMAFSLGACSLVESEEEIAEEFRSLTVGNQTLDFVQVGELWWSTKNLYLHNDEKHCAQGLLSNCEKYGSLYTWTEAMGISPEYEDFYYEQYEDFQQGLCPEGSHLPSRQERDSLISHLFGSFASYQKYFNNQRGGYYDDYLYDSYNDVGYKAYFWTSTESSNSSKYSYFADVLYCYSDGYCSSTNKTKTSKLYIRCVMN